MLSAVNLASYRAVFSVQISFYNGFRLFLVSVYGLDQIFYGTEPPLFPQPIDEVHTQRVSVQILSGTYDVCLAVYRGVLIYRRVRAHVGYAGENAQGRMAKDSVNSVRGDKTFRQKILVGCGKSQGAAQLLSLDNSALQDIRVSQMPLCCACFAG